MTSSEPWPRALAWIERELGGRVVRHERQPRWRAAWFFDLERGGESLPLPLYFRGDRSGGDPGVYPLEREMRILQALAAAGIPVPQVYGFCPDPRGIVMERVRGRPDLASSRDAAERRAVLDDYISILARMHALDLAPFEAAGLPRPLDPDRLALGDFDHWERRFRRGKRRPEPLIEFVIGWLRRNVPQGRSRVSFVAGDSGQFLFDAGRVTAILDLELAHLGDPVADLAALRCRDMSEPLGDLARAVRRYGEITGEPVDLAALDYHTVRFALCTPMAVAPIVASPPAGTDLVQYLSWYLVFSRVPLELIAHAKGIELGPAPRPEASAWPQPAEKSFEAYASDAARRLAEYQRRADEFGPEIAAAELGEVAALLGSRPASAREADAALERFVAEAGPEHDAALVRLFHRRVQRHEALLRPVMRDLAGAKVQMLD